MTLGVFFLGLSKAIDTIQHDILWAKLEYYGTRSLALDWFKFNLTDRTQQVCFADNSSYLALILCGLLQGSILGPLILIFYINSITYNASDILFYLFTD